MEAMDHSAYQLGARAAANVEKFLAQARMAAQRQSLDEFVEEIPSWCAPRIRASRMRRSDDVANAVKVMTVHSAKGIGIPRGLRGGAAQRCGIECAGGSVLAGEYGLGARWRNPAKREEEGRPVPARVARRMESARAEKESDRLLYVAMTRAEEHLVLSFSARKNWAKDVAGKLALVLDAPVDHMVTRTAPDGKQWNLRVVMAAEAPPLVPVIAARDGSSRG